MDGAEPGGGDHGSAHASPYMYFHGYVNDWMGHDPSPLGN
jgi:hypothetical protein